MKDPLIVSLKKNNEAAASVAEMQSPPPFPRWMLALLFIVFVSLAAGWYIYGGAFFEAVRAPSDLSMSGLSSSTVLRSSGPVVAMTTTELLAKVSRLMEVPAEEPSLAVVADLAPLKDQAFFRNARVGDIVLMFKKSLRAVLYDPEQDKIIEVAPITLTE